MIDNKKYINNYSALHFQLYYNYVIFYQFQQILYINDVIKTLILHFSPLAWYIFFISKKNVIKKKKIIFDIL